MSAKTGRSGQSGKSVEERVSYAVGHRVRVEILTLLIEGVYTADDLAAIVGESRQNVHHHLKELLSGQSIEIARVEKRRNTDLHYYRAVAMPSFSEKDLAALSPEQRQAIAAIIVQHSTAELMAALAAGRLNNDLQVCLAWRWFNLDEQGRQEVSEEQHRLWERYQEIEAASTSRRVESGEEARSYILAEWGFERARTAPTAPSAAAD